jgi:hypothetical protein
MAENLWGELPDVSQIRTPYTVLKEQASLLTDMTKGTLVGEVNQTQDGTNISLGLRIRAPALNNYIYAVLNGKHNLSLYPVSFWSAAGGQIITCATEEEFMSRLGTFLKNDAVRNVIKGLLAQAHAQQQG